MPDGMVVFALAVSATMLVSCGAADNSASVQPWPKGDSSYAFSQPDAQFQLAGDLEEISGLVLLDDGTLGAIQDEEGILYILDPTSGEIVDRRTFGSSGDYEAIELAEGRLLILESDGTVHRFDSWNSPSFQGETFTLDIPGRCDAEGMRYDAEDARLLVTCKDEPGPNLELEKAIYAFGLDGAKLSERPAYTMDPRGFVASVEDHPVNDAVRSVLSDRVDLSGFKPSELAIHPLTGEFYILSSVRGSVASLARDGVVTGVWVLPEELMDQPEGMAFLPNGDVFIASEAGDKSDGTLFKYTYRRAPQNAP